MNHILFRIAELEEKFRKVVEKGSQTDRIVGQTQLRTLELFKYRPIRSYEESIQVLKEIDLVFGVSVQ